MTGKDSLAFSYSIIKTLQEVATARSDTEPTNDHDLLLGMAALLHKAELYESYREVKSENRNFIKLIKKRGIDRVVGIPPFAVGPVGINVITQRGAIDLALDTAQRVIAYNYYPDDAPPRHYIAASQRRGSAGADADDLDGIFIRNARGKRSSTASDYREVLFIRRWSEAQRTLERLEGGVADAFPAKLRPEVTAELERLAKIADSGLPSAWRGRVLREATQIAREFAPPSPALATFVSFQKHVGRWAQIHNLRPDQARDVAQSAASAATKLRDVCARLELKNPGVMQRLGDAVALFEKIRAAFEGPISAAFEQDEATSLAETQSRGRPERKELRAYVLLVRESWREHYGEELPHSAVANAFELLFYVYGYPAHWFPLTSDKIRAAVLAILQGKKERLKERRSRNKSRK